jgi:outer membrane protein assembly factor BamD (BamD/ComL family)
MKPASRRFPSSCLLALVSTLALSQAGDIIKLKSGEKLDGKIINKTATEVSIEVQIGKIKDTKHILMKDIVEVIEATPDQFEAAELAKLIPAEDGLSDNAYQKIITEKLEAFLKKYPASKQKKDVEAILATYKDELAKAKSGSKKIEGKWVLPAELVWNAYNIEARLKRVELQKLLVASEKDSTKVADAYRLLGELELEKSASVETVAAIEAMKKALPGLEATLDRLILEQPIKVKNQTEANKGLSPEDKKKVEAALKEEAEKLKMRQEEDKKGKLALVAFSDTDLKSLTDAKAAVQKEIARLAKLDVVKVKEAATTFQTGLKNFSEKAYLNAQRNFEDAAKVFLKEPFVKERAELAKKAAAEALRAANEANAAKPKPSADPKTADPKAKEPAKTEGGQPVKKPAAADGDGETKPESGDAAPAESSSSLSVILIGGAAALLVILLIVKALAKKKGGSDD